MINKEINVTYNGFIPDTVLYTYAKGLVVVIPKESEFNRISEDVDAGRKLIKLYKKLFDDVYYQIDTVEYVSSALFKKQIKNIDTYLCNYRNKSKKYFL